MSAHPVVHIELSANSMEEAKQFYGEVFGWTFQDFPEMNYVTFSWGSDQLGGGFNQISEQVPAGSTVIYINTDDIESSMEAIEAHGGERLAENIEVPGVGTLAWFRDPAGNMMSLLQPAGDMSDS